MTDKYYNSSLPHSIIAICLLSMCAIAHAGSDVWMTDYDAALEKAKAQNKHVLVNFDGSPWCSVCALLEKEVLGKEQFISEITNDYVLVVLNFPIKKEDIAKIPKPQYKRNRELKQKFGVRGFPSIVLVDNKGNKYATTGYIELDEVSYLAHLRHLRAQGLVRKELRAKLEGTKGIPRAKILDEIVQATDQQDWMDRLEDMEEIIKLDSENTAGLKHKYSIISRITMAHDKIRGKAFDEAGEIYASIITDVSLKGAELQDIYFMWGQVKFFQEDYDGVVEILEKALAAAPESKRAKPIKQMIKRFSHNVEPATQTEE